MVKEIRIYFDGDRRLRRGFHQFLAEVIRRAQSNRVGFSLIAGEGHAIRDLIIALQKHPEACNVLLIDSEGPDDGQLLMRLHERGDWQPPRGQTVASEHIQWMVQLMESWFLADREVLARYYGQGFASDSLPGDPARVEMVPKGSVLNGLKRATQRTQKGAYHKTKHAPDLLAQIDPGKVRQSAGHCERLFATLLSLLK